MVKLDDYKPRRPSTWCPGCGNFGILDALKAALVEIGLQPHQVLIVSGIGQAAKLPQYTWTNTFNVLHGRTLPVATGAKTADSRLTVIAVGGDGDGYAEGGNHLIHAMRRNVEVTYLVHNNQIYGLTKGQASPTTDFGSPTTTTPRGNPLQGLNPVLLALGARGTFVARAYAGQKKRLQEILVQALKHKGFSFVDILQPCVTFNKVNTYAWYNSRVYDANASGHDPSNLEDAFHLARQWGDRIPTGLLYQEARSTFNEALAGSDAQPLVLQRPSASRIQDLFEGYF